MGTLPVGESGLFLLDAVEEISFGLWGWCGKWGLSFSREHLGCGSWEAGMSESIMAATMALALEAEFLQMQL